MFVAAIAKQGIAKPFQFQLGPRSFHNWNGWKRTDPHWENLKGARGSSSECFRGSLLLLWHWCRREYSSFSQKRWLVRPWAFLYSRPMRCRPFANANATTASWGHCYPPRPGEAWSQIQDRCCLAAGLDVRHWSLGSLLPAAGALWCGKDQRTFRKVTVQESSAMKMDWYLL